MGRTSKTPKDPTFEIIEKMVADSGLMPTTQDEVINFSRMMLKAFLEKAMQGEMKHFLKTEPTSLVVKESVDEDGVITSETVEVSNSRNGFTPKTVSTPHGKFTIKQPRDRHGNFEPRIVPKHSRRFEGFDEQIISLYARGLSTRDIRAHLYEIYGTDVSADLISQVTNEILEEVEQWQNRPLEAMYPVIYFDALRIKIRNSVNKVIPKAMYIALGVRIDGTKEVLGMWLQETESASYWLSVFNELKGRGVKDVLIAVTDGLKGLPEAFETAFPDTIHQTCIVHLIRNSMALVAAKNRPLVTKSIKAIYQAATAEAAEMALNELEASEFGKRYPMVIQLWRNAWDRVIPFFAFSPAIRKLIYTTNAIESFNRSIRKTIKAKGCFPTDDAALKIVWLTIQKLSKAWKRPSIPWANAMEEFTLLYGHRFTQYLD